MMSQGDNRDCWVELDQHSFAHSSGGREHCFDTGTHNKQTNNVNVGSDGNENKTPDSGRKYAKEYALFACLPVKDKEGT